MADKWTRSSTMCTIFRWVVSDVCEKKILRSKVVEMRDLWWYEPPSRHPWYSIYSIIWYLHPLSLHGTHRYQALHIKHAITQLRLPFLNLKIKWYKIFSRVISFFSQSEGPTKDSWIDPLLAIPCWPISPVRLFLVHIGQSCYISRTLKLLYFPNIKAVIFPWH